MKQILFNYIKYLYILTSFYMQHTLSPKGGAKDPMAHTGINHENVKINNRRAILTLLNERGAMSRKDLAMELGLTPASVTLICAELIANGILCEQGQLKEDKRVGRKKILVGINYSCRYVLCITIESEDTCITLCDLKGTDPHIHRIKTNPQIEPCEFLHQVAQAGLRLIEQLHLSEEALLGVGVSIPGLVDHQRGISQSAYRIWNKPVSVSACLQQYFACPIIVENNVKSFAMAELIYGCGKQHKNILFLKWGYGIGSALTIENKIYESQVSKEAEIGHIPVDKRGALCRCGRRGCLETKASIHAIVKQIRSHCTAHTMPYLYELVHQDPSQIHASNIKWWFQAQEKDEGLWKILDPIIERVALVTSSIITFLAPDIIIVYGQVFDLPHVKDHFIQHCKRFDASYDESYIRMSTISDQIDYIGPLAVAVNELFICSGGDL